MIPRKLHYIWFGNEALPEEMRALIAEWSERMPDFTVKEWNESNIDIAAHPWMERMYREGKYAFASDYARLLVLRDEGGIYLDTDVRINKSLEPFLDQRCFWSFEFDHFISTCIIGCAPGHPLVIDLLRRYDRLEKELVNNVLVTEYFIEKYPEFRLNNKEQTIGKDIHIYPKEYFVIPTKRKEAGYSVHLAMNHWKGGGKRLKKGEILRSIIGDALFFKFLNLQMGLQSDLPAKERARRKV